MHYQQPYELRNIKNTPDGHYQIQFIREGKSHSSFAKNLKEAKKLRNKMEVQLGIVNQQFNSKPLSHKTSMILGTNKIMRTGLSLYYSEKRKQYHVLAHWYQADKKPRSKAFYAGTDNTYFQGKGDEAYARAVEFREEWENALSCNQLEHFDPAEFNLN
jgi:hypothetical protein